MLIKGKPFYKNMQESQEICERNQEICIKNPNFYRPERAPTKDN